MNLNKTIKTQSMEMDLSQKRALEYASKLSGIKDEGLCVVYDSYDTNDTVNEFYTRSHLDYNYVYFESEGTYCCFETMGYNDLDNRLDDVFRKDSNRIDVSINNDDGFCFILESDTNEIIFVAQRENDMNPKKLQINPTRLILLSSFPIKDKKIDIEKYFKSRLAYRNGKIYSLSIPYNNERYIAIVLRKDSETYILERSLSEDSYARLKRILGEYYATKLREALKRRHKETMFNDSYCIEMAPFELIFKESKVIYKYESEILAAIDYDDVTVLNMIDDTLFTRKFGYRLNSNVDNIVQDTKILELSTDLYEADLKKNYTLPLDMVCETFSGYLDDIKENLKRDLIVSYDLFLDEQDFDINLLFNYYTHCKRIKYGFDSDLIALLPEEDYNDIISY